MVTSHCSWQAVVLTKASINTTASREAGLLGLEVELAGDEVRVAAQPAIAPARSHRQCAALARCR